jgi:hypothetical protein
MKTGGGTARGMPPLTPRKQKLEMDQMKECTNERHRFERRIVKLAV